MASLKKLKKKENVQAKLRRLKKLARETSRLSAEIFRDLVSVDSVRARPRPRKGLVLLASSVPTPPRPKFEALADLAYGAGVIEDGASDLVE